MSKWVWGAVAVLAGVGVYLFASKASASTSGDLCIKDLPEPFKSQALAKIAEGAAGAEHMNSFATQCDVQGWHCAAKELRAAAASATASSHATQEEKDKRARMDLIDVARDSSVPAALKTQATTALATFMDTTKIASRDVLGSLSAVHPDALFPTKPDATLIARLDAASTALKAAGYVTAAGQVADLAKAARAWKPTIVSAPVACQDAINALPADMPFAMVPMPSGGVLREWVHDQVASKDGGKIKWAADYLDLVASTMDEKIAAGTTFSPSSKVYRDASKCIRALLPLPFVTA